MTCEDLRAATAGCEVVLLVATDPEAGPLAAALQNQHPLMVATKKIIVGEFVGEGGSGGSPLLGRRVVLAISGLDKVNAAHLLTCLLQAMDPGPRLVLQVGIAGAFPGTRGFAPAAVGDIVIATREAYSDTGSSSPDGWVSAQELGWAIARVDGVESGGVFPGDSRLVTGALEALATGTAREEDTPDAALRPEPRPRLLAGPCVTASLVTGRAEEAEVLAARWDALAESMEGAAAAHVCALYGVPFLEVRGISNLVGDRNRAAWEVPRAVAAASWAAGALVAGLDGLPLTAPQTGAGS